MGREINLMAEYPQAKRNVKDRGQTKTVQDRSIARQFGKEFFDGDRNHGYGGFKYDPRFWSPVIPVFQKYWDLGPNKSLLDVGCAKGFMIYDIQRLIPGLEISGIDISEYAIKNAQEEVKKFCRVGNATELPFEDNSFDVVISITTLHNLYGTELINALKEIERVSSKGSFITVDAYRTQEEKERIYAWNLTAKTVLHTDEWKKLFEEAGYSGDYYWFIP